MARRKTKAQMTDPVPLGGLAYAAAPRETGRCEGNPCLVCAQMSGFAADEDGLEAATTYDDISGSDMEHTVQTAERSRVIPRSSVFAWVRGGTMPRGSASRFVAEFLAVLWFVASALTLFACSVEFFFAADTIPGVLVQLAFFGRAPNSHTTPLAIFALHILDTQCDDILQLGRPTPLRRRFWSCTRRNCGCSQGLSQQVLAVARHWGTGCAIRLCSLISELLVEASTNGFFTKTTFTIHWLGWGRAFLNIAFATYTVLLGWTARTHVLQVGLTRASTVIVLAIAGWNFLTFAFMPFGVMALGNSFLVALGWGVLFPGAVYVLMLYEDSSRVDALTQFLQYISHEVRGPSSTAVNNLQQIQRRLAVLRRDLTKLPAVTNAALGDLNKAARKQAHSAVMFDGICNGTILSAPMEFPAAQPVQTVDASTPSMTTTKVVKLRQPTTKPELIASPDNAAGGFLKLVQPTAAKPSSQQRPNPNLVADHTAGDRPSHFRATHLLPSLPSENSNDSFDDPEMPIATAQSVVATVLNSFVGHVKQRMDDMSSAARGADASLSTVTALLDRTLDLARLEAGHGAVQPSRFQVAALWSDVVRAVAPAYRDSGVRLHFKVGDIAVTADRRVAFPDIWRSQSAAMQWVLGDRLRLHQSLVALLDNGARYTARGGHVRVSLNVASMSTNSDLGALGITQEPFAGALKGAGPEAKPKPRNHAIVAIDDSTDTIRTPTLVSHPLALRVNISDTGCGISVAQQAQLFTPFVRLQAGSSGTGLSLNIAKRAMRAHGGDVQVVSQGIDKGSTFTLSALVYSTSEHAAGDMELAASFRSGSDAAQGAGKNEASATLMDAKRSVSVTSLHSFESKRVLHVPADPAAVQTTAGTLTQPSSAGGVAALWERDTAPFTKKTFAAQAVSPVPGGLLAPAAAQTESSLLLATHHTRSASGRSSGTRSVSSDRASRKGTLSSSRRRSSSLGRSRSFGSGGDTARGAVLARGSRSSARARVRSGVRG